MHRVMKHRLHSEKLFLTVFCDSHQVTFHSVRLCHQENLGFAQLQDKSTSSVTRFSWQAVI